MMKQIILFNFLLFPLLLLATENPEQYIKTKIRTNDNITTIKFLIMHPMIGDERYNNQRDLEENYITHITARNSDKIILDISTSSYLKTNPVLQHKFMGIKQSKILKYIITDNKEHKNEYTIDTNKSRSRTTSSKVPTSFTKGTVVNYRRLKPKVWEALNIEEAITELYGIIKNPIKDKINLSGPESTYCDENIPIHISSDIDLESLAIFNDKIEHPAIAIFSIPNNSIIDFNFGIKMFKTCTDYSVVAIGKDRNGNVYKTSTKGRIACADGCGGGG